MEVSPKVPYVTVVIPCFNEEQYISDCVSSVKKQQVQFPFEVIVVDNASTDKTSEVAKKEGAEVIFEEKKGLAFARQAGLDHARGDVLVYLDADTRIVEGWLEKVVSFLDSHTDVVALSCNSYLYDGKWGDTIGNQIFQSIIVPISIFFLRIFGKPDFLLGFAMVMRTDALRNSGGTNKKFIFYGEDVMLAKQLSTQGKVRFLPNVFVRTSARRYQKQGLFNTLFLYWTTDILIMANLDGIAAKFSKRFS